MRLWAEVWSADESTWYGIVNVYSLSISSRLDEAAAISFQCPATDPDADEYLQIGRVVRLFWDKYGKRQLAKAVLLKQGPLAISSGSIDVTWEATDTLEYLRRENTLRGLIYNDETIADVARDLVEKVTGWSCFVESGVSGNTSQRFDGVSILQALQKVAQDHGYHFRLEDENLVRFGLMGNDSGIEIVDVARHYVGMPGHIAVVERLDIAADGYEIVNWIEPVSGPVDGQLTLKRSTRTSPYPILTTTGPNGQTVYYLTDSDSVAAYGTIKRVTAPERLIVPVTHTTTALVNASNVLYDWAVTKLQRQKDPVYSYSISAIDVKKQINPGQKVRLRYRGEVYQGSELVRYADIDDDFWIMEVTENYADSGHTVSLVISSTDALPVSADGIIAAMTLGQQIGSIQPTMNVDRQEVSDTSTASRASPVEVEFTVQATTVTVPSLRVKITRSAGGPQTFAVYLDDIVVSGGPWLDTADAPHSFEVGIEDILIEDVVDDGGTIQGDHTVKIEVLYGSGDIDTLITLVEAIVPGIGAPADPLLDRA